MKFALIRQCDCYVDFDRTNVVEQINTILNDQDYVTFVEYDDTNMHKMIYDLIGNGTEFPKLTLLNLYDSKYDIYIAYFVDKYDLINNTEFDDANESSKNESSKNDSSIIINNFASQLTSHPVVGNMIITKMELSYKIDGNNIACNTKPTTLSNYDIVDMATNIFIKTGLSVDPTGNKTCYKYIVNPFEVIMLTEQNYDKIYRYHDYEIFDRVIQVIVSTRFKDDDKTNEVASWLCNRIVKGSVRIAMYKKPEFNENPPYITLREDILDKIVLLRKKSSGYGTTFSKSPNEYVNFEMLLDSELSKHNNESDRKISDLNQVPLNAVT